MNLFEAVGGEATFLRLTDAFYDRVAADPLLRPLFPADMQPGKRRLANFLIESLGGPRYYSMSAWIASWGSVGSQGCPDVCVRHAHAPSAPAPPGSRSSYTVSATRSRSVQWKDCPKVTSLNGPRPSAGSSSARACSQLVRVRWAASCTKARSAAVDCRIV